MKNANLKRQNTVRILLALMIILNILLPVFADSAPKNFAEAKVSKTIPSERFAARFVDEEGILSEVESSELLANLDRISEANDIDVVMAVVKNTGGQDIVAFADDYFDYNGFGMGEKKEDGILFLLSMEDRKWAISTSGFCIKIFSDYGQSFMMDKYVSTELRHDLYNTAFTNFLGFSEKLIIKATTDKPYTDKEIKNFRRNWTSPLWYAVPIGFLIAVGVIIYKLPDAEKEQYANDYLVPGSTRIFVKKNILLYEEKKCHAKSTSDSGGSGGSSTHTSSSGREHGGSSGSF